METKALHEGYEVQEPQRIAELATLLAGKARGRTVKDIRIEDQPKVRVFTISFMDGGPDVEFSIDILWDYGRHRTVEQLGGQFNDFDNMRITIA